MGPGISLAGTVGPSLAGKPAQVASRRAGVNRARACTRCVDKTTLTFRYLAAPRRIYRGGFTDFTREGISALGSLPLWGNSKFYLRVRSLPGVNPKPPFSPILDSTALYRDHPLLLHRASSYILPYCIMTPYCKHAPPKVPCPLYCMSRP